MNGKTILLLILVALAGFGLGAVGVRHIETFFASTQTPSAPRHQDDQPQAEARPTGDQPTSRAKHDEHRHADEKHVRLNAEKIKQLGIEVAVAQAGRLQERLTVPGTVTLNTDRRVHIVSRVPGVVREVRKALSEVVREGELLAVIDSWEFADAKTACLAARERVALAEATFAREKSLWEKQISSEQDYLTARQALAEAQIERRGATHKLQALGFAEPALHQLASRPEAPLTRYEMVAPFAGTVIEKHIAVGSFLKDDTDAFVIADLSTVRVHLNLAPTDVPLVRQARSATSARWCRRRPGRC
jgi:cobalt-zinc-cadmium efflux system membrane fusion protein